MWWNTLAMHSYWTKAVEYSSNVGMEANHHTGRFPAQAKLDIKVGLKCFTWCQNSDCPFLHNLHSTGIITFLKVLNRITTHKTVSLAFDGRQEDGCKIVNC